MSKAKLATVAALGAAAGAGSLLLIESTSEAPTQPGNATPPPDISHDESPGLVILPKSLPPRAPVVKGPPPNLVDPAGILKYGNPGPVNDKLKAVSLFGAYDRRSKNPYWVAEHMTPESVFQSIGKRKNNFKEDTTIPAAFRAKVKDYTDSGYDRGHQVPCNPSKWSQEAVDETFRMSNMCPQVGIKFNRHYWAYFEAFCKNLTTKYPSVRVITGPLYLPEKDSDGKWRISYEVIGNPPRVAVPTHFYKIIFGEEKSDNHEIGSKVAVGAFLLPNGKIDNDKNLQEFEVEIGALERASGLEFAQNLKTSQRRRLCEEVKCDINVRDFSDAVDDLAGEVRKAKL